MASKCGGLDSNQHFQDSLSASRCLGQLDDPRFNSKQWPLTEPLPLFLGQRRRSDSGQPIFHVSLVVRRVRDAGFNQRAGDLAQFFLGRYGEHHKMRVLDIRRDQAPLRGSDAGVDSLDGSVGCEKISTDQNVNPANLQRMALHEIVSRGARGTRTPDSPC